MDLTLVDCIKKVFSFFLALLSKNFCCACSKVLVPLMFGVGCAQCLDPERPRVEEVLLLDRDR